MSLAEALSMESPARPDEVLELLKTGIAHALRVDPDRVAVDVPLSALGLDSLAAVELSHQIEAAIGVEAPLTGFLANQNLTELSHRLAVAPAARRGAESMDRCAMRLRVNRLCG